MASLLREKLRKKLKDRRYWFSHIFPVNTGRFLVWPMSAINGSENLLEVQSGNWYNKGFWNLKSKEHFSKKDFSSESVVALANGRLNTACSSSQNFKSMASLVSNGFTSSVKLGQLRAINVNLSAAKNRLHSFIRAHMSSSRTENLDMGGIITNTGFGRVLWFVASCNQ